MLKRMTYIPSRNDYTRNVLVQFAAAMIIFIFIIFWRQDFFTQIYVKNQIGNVGQTINGGIILLFLLGLFLVVKLLVRYMHEEESINRFAHNLTNKGDLLEGVDDNSMVSHRIKTLQMLHRKRATINHSALAATLVAKESSYNSVPKFVHNTLILTGVFGTIVSLSIALLGASDLIDSAQINSIGTVIHGMSTALSTTMTAIVAYLFFGYFYLKLTDAQTYLISRVEEITATHLMPHYQLSPEKLQKEYADTVISASNLVKRFDTAQDDYQMSAQDMAQAIAELKIAIIKGEQQTGLMSRRLDTLVEIAQKSYEKENHLLERVVDLLSQNSNHPS